MGVAVTDVIVKINTNQKTKRCQQSAKQRINDSLNTRRIVPQPKIKFKKTPRFGSNYRQKDIKNDKVIPPQVKYKKNNKNRENN
jgi:hypothetical protein